MCEQLAQCYGGGARPTSEPSNTPSRHLLWSTLILHGLCMLRECIYGQCAHEQHVRRTLTLTLTHTITAYSVSGNVVRVRKLICATRQKPCRKRVYHLLYLDNYCRPIGRFMEKPCSHINNTASTVLFLHAVCSPTLSGVRILVISLHMRRCT